MLSDRHSHLLTTLIAGVATVAVFAKLFTPYYLVGSTPISPSFACSVSF